MNLREFVDLLEEKGRLKRITKEVDPVYEVAALMDEAGDTPLYLENVKGSIIPCISNILIQIFLSNLIFMLRNF